MIFTSSTRIRVVDIHRFCLSLLCAVLTIYSSGQKSGPALVDSLSAVLQHSGTDTDRIKLLARISLEETNFNTGKALDYGTSALSLANKINWLPGVARAKTSIGRVYWRRGNFAEAITLHQQADSIYTVLGNEEFIARMKVFIGQDYADKGDYSKALQYFHLAHSLYQKLGDKFNLANVDGLFSWVYQNQGNYVASSKATYDALKIYEALGDDYGIAVSLSNIASDYTQLNNLTEALSNYRKSIPVLEKVGDFINLADAYNSMGSIYLQLENFNTAADNHHKALTIANNIKDGLSIGNAYHGLGAIQFSLHHYDSALYYFLLTEQQLQSVSNTQQLGVIDADIAQCYTRLGKYNAARSYFSKVLAISRELNTEVLLPDYYKGMEQLDSSLGNWKSAYFHHKSYIDLHDRLYSQESTRKLLQARMQYDVDKAEAEEKEKQRRKDIKQRTLRNTIIAALAGTLIFLVVVYRQRNKIAAARKRSDELLLNILPAETAEELKRTGHTQAKDFDHVTILFTDFKNFTLMSEQLTAQELVNEINYCYSSFDEIISKYQIEKIKTIGDSYMCVSGLPVANPMHAINIVNAALDIRDFVRDEIAKRATTGRSFFDIRIGCNTGPVVAGIVGIKKFAYDIWGDAVNIASRMESSGVPGKVNISGSTYELVKEQFTCTYRGKIAAKNMGEIDMYLVERMSGV